MYGNAIAPASAAAAGVTQFSAPGREVCARSTSTEA
jgi:hypothetical protein